MKKEKLRKSIRLEKTVWHNARPFNRRALRVCDISSNELQESALAGIDSIAAGAAWQYVDRKQMKQDRGKLLYIY